MFMFFVLVQTLCFAEESVDLGKIRGKTPGFRQVPGFFPPLDGFQAEAASIEIRRRHVERLEEGSDALVPPVFALTGPLHDRWEPANLDAESAEVIDESVEKFPMYLNAVAAFGVFGVY